METKHAVGYFRVSTLEQSEHGVSLDVQLERFQQACKKHGYLSAGTFTDVETGRNPGRAEYQRMLAALRDGFDGKQNHFAGVVVVQFLDRFGRDAEEMLTRVWELQRLGVVVEPTDENITGGDGLMLFVSSWKAQQESKRIGERVAGALAHKARTEPRWAHGGSVPFGYQFERVLVHDKAKRYLVPEPHNAELMRTIAARYLAGDSFHSLAAWLNERGYTTQEGAVWKPSLVRQVLVRPINIGLLIWKTREGEVIRSQSYEPLLDAETYTAILDRVKQRGKVAPRALGSPHLLSGLLRCGVCGSPCVVTMTRRHYRSYVCNRRRETKQCDNRHHSARKLEAAVLAQLAAFADADLAEQQRQRATRPDYGAERTEIERELSEVEAAFLKTFRAYTAGLIADERQYRLGNEDLKRREDALRLRLTEIDESEQRAALQLVRAEAFPQNVRSFLDDFLSIFDRQKKARLAELITEIKVYPDRHIEIFFAV